MPVGVTDLKVRGYHLDLFGHVNNARYLEFLEEGRWAFADQHLELLEWRKRGIIFSVVNININYRRPALMGDMIEIRTTVARLGKASAVMHQDIFLKGTQKLVADADVTFTLVDPHTQKATPLTGEIRAAFEALIEPGK